MKHLHDLATLLLAVLLPSLTTASARAQRPTPLRSGAGVEVALDGKRTAKLTLTPRSKRLVRVLVKAVDGAGTPKLKVRQGSYTIKPAVSHFQSYTVLEWPCVRAKPVSLTVNGRSIGDRYVVKWVGVDLPVANVPATQLKLPMNFALSHTAWARVKLKAKELYQLSTHLDQPGNVTTQVRGADGGTIRHKATDSVTKWTAKKTEQAYLELRAHSATNRKVTISMCTGKRRPFDLLIKEVERLEETPPPTGAWPHETTLRVPKGEAAEQVLYFDEEYVGKTFVIEAIGTSLADPTLCLRNFGLEVLAWDDDSGDGANAKLRFKVPKNQEVLVYIRSFQDHLGGQATLRWQPEEQ